MYAISSYLYTHIYVQCTFEIAHGRCAWAASATPRAGVALARPKSTKSQIIIYKEFFTK